MKEYYEIMGIPSNASQDAVKRAYRRLARKYHPDVSTLENAEAHFKELTEAYRVLNRTEDRAAYNLAYERWQTTQNFKLEPEKDKEFGLWGKGRRHAARRSRTGVHPCSASRVEPKFSSARGDKVKYKTVGGSRSVFNLGGFGPFLIIIGALILSHGYSHSDNGTGTLDTTSPPIGVDASQVDQGSKVETPSVPKSPTENQGSSVEKETIGHLG